MTGVAYTDVHGNKRVYPHSFDLGDLEGVLAFVKSGPPIHTFFEIAMGAEGTAIRHDVDHSLAYATKFAKWEHENGIRSTYFLLPTAYYWKDEALGKLRMFAETISSYGHEIGLHHDSLTMGRQLAAIDPSDSEDEWAVTAMNLSLLQLREMGFSIWGCAAHGASGVDNLAVWDRWKLADFGLKYEAYHLNAGCNYISDNRGKLRAPLEHVEGQPARLLMHPEHWALP